MEIRKLDKWEEWLESDRIIGTAFLHGWNEQEAKEKFQKQGSGEEERREEAWGLFDETGVMQSSFVTTTRKVLFEGHEIPISEVNMAASLPEGRGLGNVRALMREVLWDFKERGDVFAVLHPFSFAFYRKFGFDLVSENLSQKVPVEQLKNFRCVHQVRQLRCAEDMVVLKKLYRQYIADKNLANLQTDRDFEYKGNGDYGEPDFWSGGKQRYTYIFSDEQGDHGYFRFVYEFGPEGPFVGDMRVTDFIYDSPAVFCSMLGFIYGMRSKLINVRLELNDPIDLSRMIPECDKVSRSLSGHLMGRVLDVRKVLEMLKQPSGQGKYRIRVEDSFLPENTETLEVIFDDGQAVSVKSTEEAADLAVEVTTFTQLALGLYPFSQAVYRPGTVINGREDIFSVLFTKKVIFAG